jgi:DNA helicase HerA-like ATPase
VIRFEGTDAQLRQPDQRQRLAEVFPNHSTAVGTTLDLGFFAAGTPLDIVLDVVTTGDSLPPGPGAGNPDGLPHANVIYNFGEAGRTFVGFEDILGGGDLDYDDHEFSFTNITSARRSRARHLRADVRRPGRDGLHRAPQRRPADARARRAPGDRLGAPPFRWSDPMADPILIAKHDDDEAFLLAGTRQPHGLITGATGTGKTITLQTMAENFSRLGVPVFMADVKGDLTGITQAGKLGDKSPRCSRSAACPRPHRRPARPRCGTSSASRATRSRHRQRHGPAAARAHARAERDQQGVLQLVFKIADDHGLLLLDLKDLRAMLQHVGDNAGSSPPSTATSARPASARSSAGCCRSRKQGGDRFFGEPMLNIADFMQTVQGRGVVNVLAADKLLNSPRLYATFLLWMLSELFEHLPEVGDLEQPKLVFFFDEAHLLFKEAPAALVERIELVVRLVRSKGVGVYFVTQNPLDIPDSVLAQLGNRVQHALRAFTPRDQKAVKAAAEHDARRTRSSTSQAAITELAVGEALVSFLDAKGRPSVTERVFVLPPGSQIGRSRRRSARR